MGDIIKNYYDNSQSNDIEIKTPMSIDKILELREQAIRKRMAEDADVLEESTSADTSGNVQETIPDAFKTVEAIQVFEKLRIANLLTDKYMPAPELTLTEKVILAGMISQTLYDGKNKWVDFQSYWKINNMSALYSQAMSQKKHKSLMERINKALK